MRPSCLPGVTDELDARADLLGRGGDQSLDLLGRAGRALCQGPDLGGDDGKAPPGIAGAGGLDPGIQGKKIGLEGNLVDHADNLADLVG